MNLARTCIIRWTFLGLTLSTFELFGSGKSEEAMQKYNKIGSTDIKTFDITIPGAKPSKEDYYVCTGLKLSPEDQYAVQFEALAEAGTAHHMLLFGCPEPAQNTAMWECGSTCRGTRSIIYAWAKNAPPTNVPKDVAFHISGSSTVKHLVLQVHYARVFKESEQPDHSGVRLHVVTKPQKYVAGIFLLGVSWLTIPAHKKNIHGDASCYFKGKKNIYPFAYRTHAHTLSTVITGYQKNETGYYLLGKGNPQWPQAFYPINESFEIKPGDLMAARCTYDATSRNKDTHIGSTHNDEMCNFYMMYYTDANGGKMYYDCWGDQVQNDYNFPPGSDVPLPPNPALDEMAHSHHHQTTPQKPKEKIYKTVLDLTLVENWPNITSTDDISLGQIAGVDTDSQGNVHIFHRGPVSWDGSSFDSHDNYQKVADGPIKVNTLITFDKNGNVINQWGKNLFYMPHGLTIDNEDNVWLTDVAMHQIFRFPAGKIEPDLTLGIRFKPGSDEKHFCKPTDIAVLKNGDFYVSDGYCNTRVLKFSKDGALIAQWGEKNNNQKRADGYPPPNSFNLPHGLALAEENNTLCVADRENGRIQCFDLDGNFKSQIHPKEFGDSVYAVVHSPKNGGMLHAVNGPPYNPRSKEVTKGFCLDLKTGDLLSTFSPGPAGFGRPHDIAIGDNGDNVYVTGIGPNKVWKFSMVQKKVLVTLVSTYKKEELNGDHKPDVSLDAENSANNGDEIVQGASMSSLIIGLALIIPIILIITVVVIVRLNSSGKLSLWTINRYDKRQGFSLGNLFNRHRGFDPLNTEELEHLTDSDGDEIEEFSSQRNL